MVQIYMKDRILNFQKHPKDSILLCSSISYFRIWSWWNIFLSS